MVNAIVGYMKGTSLIFEEGLLVACVLACVLQGGMRSVLPEKSLGARNEAADRELQVRLLYFGASPNSW